MLRTDGLWYWAEYSTFSISDEVDKYRLSVDRYSGDASNAMMTQEFPDWISNGKMFSTPDSDNDDNGDLGHCAWDGGWWHGDCSRSPINRDTYGIWGTWVGGSWEEDVQASRMMVRLN